MMNEQVTRVAGVIARLRLERVPPADQNPKTGELYRGHTSAGDEMFYVQVASIIGAAQFRRELKERDDWRDGKYRFVLTWESERALISYVEGDIFIWVAGNLKEYDAEIARADAFYKSMRGGVVA